MRKLFISLRKYPKAFIITMIVGLLVGLTIFLIYYFAIFNQTIVGALNGTGVAGAVLVAAFVLAWLSRNGAFDTLSYGFGQMFTSMFARKANKYNDFADYKQQKNTKREVASMAYVTLLLDGFIYLIAFGILEIVFHTLY